jgi:hypothetical protein
MFPNTIERLARITAKRDNEFCDNEAMKQTMKKKDNKHSGKDLT